MTVERPSKRLTAAIRNPKRPGRPALMPYLTSGWPSREGFADLLVEVGRVADVIELGVPFSDPMADGPVIQATSREALDAGVSLPWILETLRSMNVRPEAPMVLMSYLNPLLAYGLERLAAEVAALGICGFIIPDMPWEEGEDARALFASQGLAFVQLVTPVTPEERLKTLTGGESGFIYAVTVTGTTGGAMDPSDIVDYLERVRQTSPVPVCAGFGIRSATQVRALTGHADGVVVGSAFLEALRSGQSPTGWLEDLMS